MLEGKLKSDKAGNKLINELEEEAPQNLDTTHKGSPNKSILPSTSKFMQPKVILESLDVSDKLVGEKEPLKDDSSPGKVLAGKSDKVDKELDKSEDSTDFEDGRKRISKKNDGMCKISRN